MHHYSIIAPTIKPEAAFCHFGGGRGGVVVSALDFRFEGRRFEAQSLPSCCFLRQETLPLIVSLHPGV